MISDPSSGNVCGKALNSCSFELSSISDTYVFSSLCDHVKPLSRLVVHPYNSKVNLDVYSYIVKGLLDPCSELIQGVENLCYDGETLALWERPVLYPDPRLLKAISDGEESSQLVGPMTGVFAHVFDDDLYAMIVRGGSADAPGRLQIVAGYQDFGRHPCEHAQIEVEEEMHIQASHVLAQSIFLDLNPFVIRGCPQILFSYVLKGDLSDIPVVSDASGLESFERSLPLDRSSEAYPFVVPIERLRGFSGQVQERFYGPAKKSQERFLDWYNQEHKTDF